MCVREFLPRTDRSGGLEEMIAAAKARVRSVGRGWDMVALFFLLLLYGLHAHM